MNTATNKTTTAKKITVIPATKTKESKPLQQEEGIKSKVCAYARVSTELDEQQSSYDAQIKYYTDHINSNDNWEFAGIYADEGISGTSTKRREEFNRMIEDAKAGKIDIILTKSISRFARNTMDTIQITRDLKALGVQVLFEKENLDSMDPTTEVQLTILASLAQEESRNISQNVSWGQERRMREGKFHVSWSHFLGYDKGPDGRPVINEKEAEVIRTIYQMYLDGKTPGFIARHLEQQGILTPRGKKKWCTTTILSILKNEKYKGDAIIHKTVTVDFLTKRKKKNEGEAPQYYVENSHPAIIERSLYDRVQKMIKNRAKRSGHRNNEIMFNDKLVCKKCGKYYTRKKRQLKGKEHVSWNCYGKYKYILPKMARCTSAPLYEPEIRKGYVIALGEINARKGEILAKYDERTAKLEAPEYRSKLKKKVRRLEEKYKMCEQYLHDLLSTNVQNLSPDEFEQQSTELQAELTETAEKLEQAKQVIQDNSAEIAEIRMIKEVLGELGEITYTDELFKNTIEKILVSDNHLEYVFYGGEKVKVKRAEKRGSYDV